MWVIASILISLFVFLELVWFLVSLVYIGFFVDELTPNSNKRLFQLLDEFDYEMKITRVAKPNVDAEYFFSLVVLLKKNYLWFLLQKRKEKLIPPEGFDSCKSYLSWFKGHQEIVYESPLKVFVEDESLLNFILYF